MKASANHKLIKSSFLAHSIHMVLTICRKWAYVYQGRRAAVREDMSVHRMTSLSTFEESKARKELASARTPAAVDLTGVGDCSRAILPRGDRRTQRIFELIETALINSLMT